MDEMGLEDEVRAFYGRKIGEFGDEGILREEEELWQEALPDDDEDLASIEISE